MCLHGNASMADTFIVSVVRGALLVRQRRMTAASSVGDLLHARHKGEMAAAQSPPQAYHSQPLPQTEIPAQRRPPLRCSRPSVLRGAPAALRQRLATDTGLLRPDPGCGRGMPESGKQNVSAGGAEQPP